VNVQLLVALSALGLKNRIILYLFVKHTLKYDKW
jgi:hypothetical protein